MQAIVLPHIDTARRLDRPRTPKPPQTIELALEDRQLSLFAPAVMRRRAIRSRKAIAYRAIDGRTTIRWTTERIELDSGLRANQREHGDDGTFKASGYVGLDSTRYAADERAQDFVARHPEGASLAEVADALRIGKSTADDIERRAFAKLLSRAQAGDIQVRRWLFCLAQHVGLRDIAREYDDEDDEREDGEYEIGDWCSIEDRIDKNDCRITPDDGGEATSIIPSGSQIDLPSGAKARDTGIRTDLEGITGRRVAAGRSEGEDAVVVLNARATGYDAGTP